MRNFLTACIIFAVTAVVLVIYSFYNVPSSFVYKIILILGLLLVISINGFWISMIKKVVGRWGRWTLLLLVNLLIQLIVLYTGSLESPFLMFYHVTFLGISFLFSFPIALAFLLFTLVNLALHVIYDPTMVAYITQDPSTMLVYGVSFLAFIPIANILAHQYHIKDKLYDILSYQVKVEESILEEVDELVFVTDKDFQILSANETAGQLLQKNRSELLHKKLFDILFLKDINGTLIDEKILQKQGTLDKPITISDLLFISTGSSRKKVTFTIKPLNSMDEFDKTYTVIVQEQTQANPQSTLNSEIEESKLKLEAFSENMKLKLYQKGMPDLAGQFLFITKYTQDLENLQHIEDRGITERKSYIDIAQLCNDTTRLEQDFANLFQISLEYKLSNFSEQNLPPFITKILKTSPELTTGPFFTAQVDSHYIGVLIQKLLDISIVLASNSQDKKVQISVEQDFNKLITVKIICSSPDLSSLKDQLFIPHYGKLQDMNNFKLTSGLEGYLAKTIAHYLEIPIETIYDASNKTTCMIISVKKNVTVQTLMSNAK